MCHLEMNLKISLQHLHRLFCTALETRLLDSFLLGFLSHCHHLARVGRSLYSRLFALSQESVEVSIADRYAHLQRKTLQRNSLQGSLLSTGYNKRGSRGCFIQEKNARSELPRSRILT